MVFIHILLPVFIIFAVGYIGKKWLKIEIKPLSTAALYLFNPFLAFRTFYQSKLDLDYLMIVVFAILLSLLIIGLDVLIGKAAKFKTSETCALMLSTAFMNSGNYGTPVVLFALGKTGFHFAVIMMVIQALLMSTVGVYVAAKGGKNSDGSQVNPLKAVAKMPIVYGAAAGLVLNVTGLPLPDYLGTPVDYIADATIPLIMIILGMQLAEISIKRISPVNLTAALAIRLLISPVLAVLLVSVLPVSGVLASVLIIQAAMPSAANTTMYALEFNTETNIVTSATLLSTLGSLITLPIILQLFG